MDSHEYQPPTELLSVTEIEERRALIHKIEQTIRRQKKNFRMKQRHLGPAFFIPRKTLEAFIDDSSKQGELHQLLESNYAVSCSFRLDQTDDEEATRSESEMLAARSRDRGGCIISGNGDPRETFIFPFSATNTEAAVLATALRFEHTMPVMGTEFFATYCKNLVFRGFDNRGNICCLNRHMVKWLRMGYWAFESLKRLTSKKLELGDSIESIDATIDRVIQRLSVAQANGLPPRSPKEGSGFVRFNFHGGELLHIGHIIRVQHETKEEAIFFRNMINMHWVYLRVGMISC